MPKAWRSSKNTYWIDWRICVEKFFLFIFAALWLGVSANSAANSSQQYTHYVCNFKAELPADWDRSDYSNNQIRSSFVFSKKVDNGVVLINISKPTPISSDPARYLQDVQFPNMARSKAEQIADEYYIEMVDTKEVLFSTGKESTRKYIGGIFVVNNHMVNINYSAPAQHYDTYLPLFRQVLLTYQPLN